MLTLINEDTREVEFENKATPSTASQNWTLGQKDKNGWRTIVHTETGLYLTTKLQNKYAVLRVEEEGE